METKKRLFINRKGLQYRIVSVEYRTPKNTYYRVRFLVSGAEKVATMSDITRGKVKDVLHRSVAGVGYYGTDDVEVNSTSRAYRVWHNMIVRCYDAKSKEYKTYGAKGVTVCPEWHSFTRFARDIVYLPGFNRDDFENNKIHLDKDLLQNGTKKIYSPQTCVFLSSTENSRIANNNKYRRPILATSPEGKQYFYSSVRAFVIQRSDFRPDNIYQVLCGAAKKAHGWTFKYCIDYRKPDGSERVE